MNHTFILETLEQIRAFSHPVRYQALNLLALKPMTGAQLGRALKMPRQRMHYHIKILREAGLIVPAEDIQNGSAIEIFYRSVAENFASPLLVNLTSQADAGENATVRDAHTASSQAQRAHSQRELSLTLVEQVKSDLYQPGVLQKMAEISSPFQYGVFLTPRQEREFFERFQALKRDLVQQAEQNLADGKKDECLSLRYTLLVTPVYTADED